MGRFLVIIFSIFLSVPWSIQQSDSDYTEANDLQTQLRSEHSAEALDLSDMLNSIAQQRAIEVAATGQLNHDPNLGYGENLAVFSNTLDPSDAAEQSVQMWYNEVEYYDYNNPGFSSDTGHFTQVVWVATQSVGFGVAIADDGSTYVSAVYDPAGNDGDSDAYRQNVLPN